MRITCFELKIDFNDLTKLSDHKICKQSVWNKKFVVFFFFGVNFNDAPQCRSHLLALPTQIAGETNVSNAVTQLEPHCVRFLSFICALCVYMCVLFCFVLFLHAVGSLFGREATTIFSLWFHKILIDWIHVKFSFHKYFTVWIGGSKEQFQRHIGFPICFFAFSILWYEAVPTVCTHTGRDYVKEKKHHRFQNKENFL